MIEITAKGYYYLSVAGAHFSSHVQEREGIERAAKVLAADPSLVCTIRPPTVEVRASEDAVPVTPAEPVTSDAGEDLIDFIERHSAPVTSVDFIEAASFEASIPRFAEQTKAEWTIRRLFRQNADGTRTWAGIGWRGYVLLFLYRDPGALRVGGGS